MLRRNFVDLLVAHTAAAQLTGNPLNRKQKGENVPILKGVEKCLIKLPPNRLQL